MTENGKDNVDNMTIPVSRKAQLFIQHDWLDVVRTAGDKIWVSCWQEGLKTIYGEITSTSLKDNKVAVNDGFEATVTNEKAILLKHVQSNCESYFYSPIKTFPNVHKKAVRCLDISPGGGLAVSSDDGGMLYVWQADDGSIRRSLEGHVSDVTHCRFFPSGSVVLSGGFDMRLKIWSIEDGSCPVTLVGHKGAITDTTIIDRGRNIVSCARDGEALLWDVGTATCLSKLTSIDDEIRSVPSVINACCLGNHQWESYTSIHDRSCREIGTANKLLVLAKNDGCLEGIDIHSRDKVFGVQCKDSLNASCFIDEYRLVAGQQNGDLVVMDIRNTSRLEQKLRYGRSPVHCLEPYFKSTILVGRADGSCSCINLEDGLLTKELTGPNLDALYDVSFANNFIYTACRDGKIRKYSLKMT